MFAVYDKKEQRIPIKMWLDNIEPDCLEQAMALSRLPYAFKHIALMPDSHLGMGVPIGSILATEGVVVPQAIGVDQGCGMEFTQTNLPVHILKIYKSKNGGSLLQEILDNIVRAIPTGFNKHGSIQLCRTVEDITRKFGFEKHRFDKYVDNMAYQVGTLGGGNHFIELQEDEDGYLAIMIHSGSRNFGLQVANYFDDLAIRLNKKWHSESSLPFLPVDSEEGQEFLTWTNFSSQFAHENRYKMMNIVVKCIDRAIADLDVSMDFSMVVSAHHNYVKQEYHYGKNVWVHRKGAISAMNGELGIIPGAMGSYSYIVRGKGSPESFHSCSHGAGRLMSRKQAKERFSAQQMMEDLKDRDIILRTDYMDNVVDESRFAYKDITEVMGYQRDLVDIVKQLETVAVIKGSEKGR